MLWAIDVGIYSAVLATYAAILSTFNVLRANRRSIFAIAECSPPFSEISVQIYNSSLRKYQLKGAEVSYGKLGDAKILASIPGLKDVTLDAGSGTEIMLSTADLRARVAEMGMTTTPGGWLWLTISGYGRLRTVLSVKVDRSLSITEETQLALGEGDFNGQLQTAELLGLKLSLIHKKTPLWMPIR